jgi:hypothetical protein
LTGPSFGRLYTTSQVAAKGWGWKAECIPEVEDPAATATEPQGAVLVIDEGRAKKDPAHAVVARVPAGCHPVRLAVSLRGDAAFVTSRKSNAVRTRTGSRVPPLRLTP